MSDDYRFVYKVTEKEDALILNSFLSSKKNKRLQESDAKSIIWDIRNVLIKCHNNHCYHDNINDTNIFLEDGKIKRLINFHLSFHLSFQTLSNSLDNLYFKPPEVIFNYR